MNKEELLRKAFSQAASNAAIRFADEDIDFLVMKADMKEFAKKHEMDVTEEEIEGYIRGEIVKLDQLTKDFRIQTKIMN